MSKAAFGAWGSCAPHLSPLSAQQLHPLRSHMHNPHLRMLPQNSDSAWQYIPPTWWNTSALLHPVPKQTFLFICTVWFSLWLLSWLRDQMQACRATECRPELKQDAHAVLARDTVHLTKYFIKIRIKKLKTRVLLSVLFYSIWFCNFLSYYVYELVKSLNMSLVAASVLQG